MEIVTKIAPICLALIMLGLGLGLSVKDFTRVLKTPKRFFSWFFFSISNFTNSCSMFSFSIKSFSSN